MSIFNISNLKANVLEYLIAVILITLPLKNIFVSIATILFVGIGFFVKRGDKLNFQKAFLIPILFLGVMALSLLWTKDFNASLSGLQKGLSFLVIPLVFFIIPKGSKESLNSIFRGYSFAMVGYAIFYIVTACIDYNKTNNINVFFNNSLVPSDPGAIYMSVFASFGLFYFVQLDIKKNYEKVVLSILTLFIFLLSSKSIITVDFIIIVCYYAFYVQIPSSTKTVTITTVSLFLIFSIFFVKEVRERFMVEYETAFVDNISHGKPKLQIQKVHNVSIKEAWNNSEFKQSDFFPGTALRVYQARVFSEIFQEESLFFTGLGLEASQDKIRNKAKKNNLFYEYGEYNFHNQYIQTFAELGFFGFLVLVTMLFVNIKKGVSKKDFLHIAFAITTIVLFLSESFFCRQRGIVFFVVFYCLFNSTTKEDRNLNTQ